MRLKKLQRKLKRQANREFHRGNLTPKDFVKAMAVADDPRALAELNDRIERDVYPVRYSGVSAGGFFANLWDWFKANWPAILKIVLTIAPLLLQERQRADS